MTVKEDYWSQKFGFPVKEKEAIAVVPCEDASNPLVAQYNHDKEGF